MRLAVLGIAFALALGCASVGMLPKSASEINFSASEGKTGWSAYRQFEMFRGYSSDQVYDAAKVGLGAAGFSLRKADVNQGFAIGEHGMTAHDWNVIAGVYFRQEREGTRVAVIVEGSKDIGFSGDVTSGGWGGEILKGMRDYLHRTHQNNLEGDKALPRRCRPYHRNPGRFI